MRLPSPPWWMALGEARAVTHVSEMICMAPWLLSAPRGDGHPVLVLPGFMANSRSTYPLRRYLKDRGYAAHRWKQGRNRGFSDILLRGMESRLLELVERYQSPVSVLGWSLGGVYARELARMHPQHVRCVITLGSPIAANRGGTSIEWLYEWIAGHSPRDLPDEMIDRLAQTPTVPTTAIYSRSDGIVHWQASVELLAHERVENIEVYGSHIGLGFNPSVYLAVADRLAVNPDHWTPFAPPRLFQSLYGDLDNAHSPFRWRRRLEHTLRSLEKALGRDPAYPEIGR